MMPVGVAMVIGLLCLVAAMLAFLNAPEIIAQAIDALFAPKRPQPRLFAGRGSHRLGVNAGRRLAMPGATKPKFKNLRPAGAQRADQDQERLIVAYMNARQHRGKDYKNTDRDDER